MIPVHLKGKSATVICEEMKTRFFNVCDGVNEKDYTLLLEGFLIQAVMHAMCNADGERSGSVLANIEEYSKLGVDAEQRAIAFLNIVLPKE